MEVIVQIIKLREPTATRITGSILVLIGLAVVFGGIIANLLPLGIIGGVLAGYGVVFGLGIFP
jgi:hypothetical protein